MRLKVNWNFDDRIKETLFDRTQKHTAPCFQLNTLGEKWYVSWQTWSWQKTVGAAENRENFSVRHASLVSKFFSSASAARERINTQTETLNTIAVKKTLFWQRRFSDKSKVEEKSHDLANRKIMNTISLIWSQKLSAETTSRRLRNWNTISRYIKHCNQT